MAPPAPCRFRQSTSLGVAQWLLFLLVYYCTHSLRCGVLHVLASSTGEQQILQINRRPAEKSLPSPASSSSTPPALPPYLSWIPDVESSKERFLSSLGRGPGSDILLSDPLVHQLRAESRIVVCVTTIPSRFDRVHP
ncbi:unnamed protein product, partial [Amoebophrya sp. A120]|eukprot:GSA120T00011187001.1